VIVSIAFPGGGATGYSIRPLRGPALPFTIYHSRFGTQASVPAVHRHPAGERGAQDARDPPTRMSALQFTIHHPLIHSRFTIYDLPAQNTRYIVVRQRILHDRAHPSFVRLPIIPR